MTCDVRSSFIRKVSMSALSKSELTVGVWYACAMEDDLLLNGAPIAEYVGDGTLVDDDEHYWDVNDFDFFVRQS